MLCAECAAGDAEANDPTGARIPSTQNHGMVWAGNVL